MRGGSIHQCGPAGRAPAIAPSHRLAQHGRLSPSTWTTSRPGIGFGRVPELACHQSPDENAVVRVVVAHRHELGKQAVESVRSRAPQTAAAVSPTWIPGMTRPRTTIAPNCDDKAQGLGEEDRQPDEQPVEDYREGAVEGQEEQACQHQRREPVDLQTRDEARRDRECQAGTQVGQDHATHDRQPGGTPLPHKASLKPEEGQPASGDRPGSGIDLGCHARACPRRGMDWPGCRTRTSTSGARVATATRKATPGPSNRRRARRRRPNG